jgi:hypothetical protein
VFVAGRRYGSIRPKRTKRIIESNGKYTEKVDNHITGCELEVLPIAVITVAIIGRIKRHFS